MRTLLLLILILITAGIGGHTASAETIGVIMTGDIPYYQEIHKEFEKSASKQGTKMIVQKPMPDPMSWTNSVRKLITLKSDLIVAYGVPAALTSMKMTSDIPIVFAGVYDPQAMNMIGRNATGISSNVNVKTMLEKLSSLSKKSKLGIILNKAEKDSIMQTKEIKSNEGFYGFQSVLLNVEGKINRSSIKDLDIILFTNCSSGMLNVPDVIEVAASNKILTAALIGGGEKQGVVLTMTANPVEQGQKLAGMVKKILNGSKPSDIPVMHPDKIDININLAEAKAIGIDVPSTLLNIATRVIE